MEATIKGEPTAETTPLTRSSSNNNARKGDAEIMWAPSKMGCVEDVQKGRMMVLFAVASLVILGLLCSFQSDVFRALRLHPKSIIPQNHHDETLDDDWTPNVLGTTNYSLAITIDTPTKDTADEVQGLFNIGLMECFGFAFGEARATAAQALQRVDQNGGHCPMCYWLLAMAHAPYINHPQISGHDYRSAASAAAMANLQIQNMPNGVTRKERGLLRAIHRRFGPDHGGTTDNEAYQTELEQLHQTMPQDPDVMAFLADAIMVLHCNETGYHFYEPDNATPRPGIANATRLLETCLGLPLLASQQQYSHHPLCGHLYIHITEPSRTPQRANGTADELSALVSKSQAQHLQHMPSHAYLRVGRYHDAILANIEAHASDEAYLQHHHSPYGAAHDTAFLIHAAQLSGEQRVAYDYADQLQAHYRAYPDRPDYPGPSLGWHIGSTVRLRFGDYGAILQYQQGDVPREDWIYAKVLGHFTKGVATCLKDKHVEDAYYHLETLQTLLPTVEDDLKDVASVANLTLSATIAFWNKGENSMPKALELIHQARTQQGRWVYTEPPGWFMSVAQCEATLLRIMGRAKEAVAIFEHDLEDIRENRFALYGLEQAMRAAPNDYRESTISNIRRRYSEASKWAEGQTPLVCPLFGQ